jgi:hypothetical protein
MGIESLPSKNAAVLDVPEVENLNVEFQYFYWTADEFENGLGSSQAALRQIPSETFDANYVQLTRRLPRLMKLSWKPITMNRDKTHRRNPIKIRDYLAKLHSEETFTSNDFTTFHYQDDSAALRLKFFIDQFTNLLPDFSNASSADEIISLVNQHTSDQVTAGFLAEIISDLSRKGVTFRNSAEASQAIVDRIKNVAINSRLNNRVLEPIHKTVREDSVGLFPDETVANSFMDSIRHIQDVAIANMNSNLISPSDYEFEVLSYVGYKPVDTNGYQPVIHSLGYIVEKREVKSDGSVEQHPPIIIEDSFTATVFDGQVRYNSVYYYRIRAVYLVEARAVDERSGQNLLVSFLVGSKFTPEFQASAVEMVPPPPPADFNVAWDYGERALRCTWNLPNNPQQDIKYIQLFRRKSIAEPFQLIQMWDFNDTHTRVPLSEYPLPELVQRTPSFVGIFLDREFGKDSDYIYAVAAIDAHGLTSNYSLQFQASFNRFDNKLVKKLVSISGAPKQYPNAYLNADTFVDTIRDSGHTSIRVVFNPDFLALVNGNSADLGLVKTDRVNGKYRLQLINVDLQAQQNVDITLQDLRVTAQVPQAPHLAGSQQQNTAAKIGLIR